MAHMHSPQTITSIYEAIEQSIYDSYEVLSVNNFVGAPLII